MNRNSWMVVVLCLLTACGSEQKTDSTDSAASNAGTPLDLDGVTVVVPEGWVSSEPSSSMRKAQFALPKHGDDAEDAALVVFYFGAGNAGSVEANLERWRGQMKGAQGNTKKASVNGMAVTTLDITGSYAAGVGMQMQPGPEVNNYHLIASIVESPVGAYYFKLTGPVQTIAHWQDSFERFVNSAKGS